MIMPIVAAMGQRLCAAAEAIGGRIDFDPEVALLRSLPALRSCRLVEAADGWIAVNLARDEDVDAVPAWIGCALDLEPWAAIEASARGVSVAALLEQAHLLGMPVAGVGESRHRAAHGEEELAPGGSLPKARLEPRPFETRLRQAQPLLRMSGSLDQNVSALDLCALWAGPYCGGLLAEAGLSVTKVESQSRPDPTLVSDPMLDARLNGRKQRVPVDFADWEALFALASQADILITSARPHALARLGLSEETLFARNPNLIWVAITAYGWHGDAAMRVGFGDDCAAAGGLVEWKDDAPHFLGDALADPLTGIAAATLAMETLAQGRTGLIDVALARVTANVAVEAELRR
jgi:CoA-transferase family III